MISINTHTFRDVSQQAITSISCHPNISYETLDDVLKELGGVAAAMGIPANEITLELDGYDGGIDITCTGQRFATPAEIKTLEATERINDEQRKRTDTAMLKAIRARSPELFFDELIEERPA